MPEAAFLVVARFLKPHGLHGETLVLPLTDEPNEVFVPGRVLVPVDEDGRTIGDELVITRARRHQRRWLLSFEGYTERSVVEQWPQQYLGARENELTPPAPGEMYEYEVPGSRVVEGESEIGMVLDLVDVPGGRFLVVEHDGQEKLIPFRSPFVVGIDREARRIDVKLPPGLLEV